MFHTGPSRRPLSPQKKHLSFKTKKIFQKMTVKLQVKYENCWNVFEHQGTIGGQGNDPAVNVLS